jgi:hypothetical protein
VVVLAQLALLVEEYQVKHTVMLTHLQDLTTMEEAVAKLKVALLLLIMVIMLLQEVLGKAEIIMLNQTPIMVQEAAAAGMAAVAP